MRESIYIDYDQIGLPYKLKTTHILLNAGLCFIQAKGPIASALKNFRRAFEFSEDEQGDCLSIL
jgi:hypothetical protein